MVGQEHLLGPDKPLRRLIEADRLTSVILWGPPGTGKTTLARLIAGVTARSFETLSAVNAGVKDVREVVARARARLGEQGQGTILFLDEVHRFNKSQQDALLPHVEDGLLTLIGATTENPYFEVNAPLLSRSSLFRLHGAGRGRGPGPPPPGPGGGGGDGRRRGPRPPGQPVRRRRPHRPQRPRGGGGPGLAGRRGRRPAPRHPGRGRGRPRRPGPALRAATTTTT